MALAAPTMRPSLTDEQIGGYQQQLQGDIPPEAEAINAAIQKTPAYQNYLASMRQGNVAVRMQAYRDLKAEGDRIGIPDNLILDPNAGVIRTKDWNEQHLGWSSLLYAGAAIGAGLTAGAGVAALGAGAGAAAAGGGGAGAGAGAAGAGTAAGVGTGAAVAGGGGVTGTVVNALINKGIPAAAQVLGGAAKSEQNQNNIGDQAALQQGNLQLGRDKFALEAPNARLATAIKASLASNFTPQHTQWAGPGSGLRGEVPKITGGLTGGLANLNPQVKDLANQVMLDELLGQKQGGPSGGGLDRKTPRVNQSSAGDKVLGGASLATSLLGSILPQLKGLRPSTGTQSPAQPNPLPVQRTGPSAGPLTEDELYQMMQQGEM